jgi:hypothetical protein
MIRRQALQRGDVLLGGGVLPHLPFIAGAIRILAGPYRERNARQRIIGDAVRQHDLFAWRATSNGSPLSASSMCAGWPSSSS